MLIDRKIKEHADLYPPSFDGLFLLEVIPGGGCILAEPGIVRSAQELTPAEAKKQGWDKYTKKIKGVDLSKYLHKALPNKPVGVV